MDYKEILVHQLDEYRRELDRALAGLTPEERRVMPTNESHHIDFALWHATRAEDLLVHVGVWVRSRCGQSKNGTINLEFPLKM